MSFSGWRESSWSLERHDLKKFVESASYLKTCHVEFKDGLPAWVAVVASTTAFVLLEVFGILVIFWIPLGADLTGSPNVETQQWPQFCRLLSIKLTVKYCPALEVPYLRMEGVALSCNSFFGSHLWSQKLGHRPVHSTVACYSGRLPCRCAWAVLDVSCPMQQRHTRSEPPQNLIFRCAY